MIWNGRGGCWGEALYDLILSTTLSSMRNTQPLSITLPHDMAAMVKAKVASGEYATESEVIRDGLRSLMTRDAAMESWLRNEVVVHGVFYGGQDFESD